MPAVYISLGSNLGNRVALLQEALLRLEREPVLLRVISPLYETVPVGGPPQGYFLNACAAFTTTLSPVKLLRRLQQIEAAMGRLRQERWGPRNIDLDLLLYEDVIMRTPVLELPHPRLAERDFVLLPLSAIVPKAELTGTGKTVGQLLEKRPPTAGIRLYRKFWYPPKKRKTGCTKPAHPVD